MSKRELLFSVTGNDCNWSYYVGPGNGGQKKNKTHSGVICTHIASGAQERCHDGRSQLQNKQSAFRKMCESDKFKAWHRIEVAKRTGEITKIEALVEKSMNPKNIKTEIQNENGTWSEDDPNK